VVTLWRKELTEAGQIHYHLLIYGIRLYSAKTATGRNANEAIFCWFDQTWAGQTGIDYQGMEYRGTRVEPMRNRKKTNGYLTKYMTKETEHGDKAREGMGRHWGVYNRKAYKDLVEEQIHVVQTGQAEQVKGHMLRAHNGQEWVKEPLKSSFGKGLVLAVSYWVRQRIETILTGQITCQEPCPF